MSDLIAQLRAAPHAFDLFQAISLLERGEPARAAVGTSLGLDEAVRLAGQADFAFPASDIASLRPNAQPGPPLTLRTAALSLGGGHGPVATPFTELLLERRSQRDHAGLDFLDIFNGRLLGFWYRLRCKRHPALRPQAAASGAQARAIDALSGLGIAEGARGPAGARAWLHHASLQGAAPRSLASLLALLRERIGVSFDGRQLVGAWHALGTPDRARLGTQRLGCGACLGARAWDQASGIALDTPPLAPAQFAALLPGGEGHPLLAWLVARHLQERFTVTLRPALAAQPASRLGGTQVLAPRLGRSAWLCSGAPSRRAYDRPCFVLREDAADPFDSSRRRAT